MTTEERIAQLETENAALRAENCALREERAVLGQQIEQREAVPFVLLHIPPSPYL